jgi:dihydroxyacetone kinase
MVNGFGGTPQQELLVFANSVLLQLAETPVKVSRVFVGNYMTSLDMTGASLTILALDDELKKLLTAPSQTPTLSITGNEKDSNYVCLDKKTKQEMTFSFEFPADYRVITDEKLTLANIHYIVDKIASVAIENEITFCELDSFAGDGDFGMSLAKGFKQLKREWKELLAHTCTIGEFLLECSLVIMEHCGGASGPIWGSAFRGAGLYADKKTELSTAETAALLQRCVQSIQDTGARAFGRGAVVGDKTLIDSLAPCADSWTEHARQGFSMVECFTQGAIAAFEGAESTRNIVARMGRAGTLGDRSLGHCDAGAYGLAIIINEVAKDFSKGSEDYE